MPVTLKDVAQHAGVSIKTVSNFIHGYEYMSEETRKRVQRSLEELQYHPNLSARYLRTKYTNVLALAIPILNNAYFIEVAQEINKAAKAFSYTVLLDFTDGARASELLVVNGLRPHLIDGIILNPFSLQLEDLRNRREGVPIVLLGERLRDVPYDHVSVDNISAASLATEHLIGLGRRRIAAIGAQTSETGETARLRLQGYMQALSQAGLPFDPQLIIEAEYYLRDDGQKAVQCLLQLDSLPDAVFCFNDLLALGAIRALQEAGYRVPEDIAVVGFDDIEEGRFAMPSLTTISPDKQLIGELAVSFLVGRIRGTREESPTSVEVPFKLVVRESTLGRGSRSS